MQTGCLLPSRFIAPAFLLLIIWPIPLTGGELPVACAMTKITNPWLVLWYHSFFSFPLRYSPARSKKRKNGSLHTHSFKVEQEYHTHISMSRVFPPPCSHLYMSRRPSTPRLSVPSSAYSRSPPMGRPRARPVIRTLSGFSSF